MKNKPKHYLKLGILLLGIPILLASCQRDDGQFSGKEKNLVEKTTLSHSDILRHQGLANQLGLSAHHSESARAGTGNYEAFLEEFQLIVNTSFCLRTDNRGTTTYTFHAYREHDNGYLANLVLLDNGDGTFSNFLTEYNLTQQEISDIVSKKQVDINGKVRFSWLDYRDPNDPAAKVYYGEDCYVIETMVYVEPQRCQSTQHTYEQGSECDFWGGSGQATQGGWESQVIFKDCDQGGGGTPGNPGSPGPPINAPHPGAGGTTQPITTCKRDCPPVLEEDGLKKECNKISNLFTDYPNYKQDLMDLAQTVDQQVENGIFVDDNSTNTQNVPQGVAGKLNINMTPQNDYVSIAHTHDASGTYSVFSWDDLTTIASLVRNGHIKTNKFVAFLFTADGTSYAFTISNSSNFLDFFYNPAGLPQGSAVDVDKLWKQQKAYDDYYKKSNAKIKINNNNNVEVRNAFLKMLRDNNMGLDVFEMDENLENFKKLNLEGDDTTVTHENCNN